MCTPKNHPKILQMDMTNEIMSLFFQICKIFGQVDWFLVQLYGYRICTDLHVYHSIYNTFFGQNFISFVFAIIQGQPSMYSNSRLEIFSQIYKIDMTATSYILCTPGPHLMRIHLVQNSISARFGKNPQILTQCKFIQLVGPIIHLVRILALSELCR